MVNGNDIVNYAKNFLGVPYVFGGTSPSGFDCSGFVQYIYKHFGINISRTTKTQINDGVEVGRNDLQPGDLVFTSNSHVTLYIGNNLLIHAPQPGEKVLFGEPEEFYQTLRLQLHNQVPKIHLLIILIIQILENSIFILQQAYIKQVKHSHLQ